MDGWKMSLKKINKKLGIILILLILFTIILSFFVSASVGDSLKTSLSNIFPFNDQPSFGDFLIFAALFCAATVLGLSKFYGGESGGNSAPVYVMAIALGLALAGGLVYGGKFTIIKFLPFSILFICVIVWVALYFFLSKVIGTDSTGKMVFVFILSVIVAVGLIIVAIMLLCGDGQCDSNPFMSKIFGSESLLAKIGIIGEGGVGGIGGIGGEGGLFGDSTGADSDRVDSSYTAAKEFLEKNKGSLTLENADRAQSHIEELTSLKKSLDVERQNADKSEVLKNKNGTK